MKNGLREILLVLLSEEFSAALFLYIVFLCREAEGEVINDGGLLTF